MDKIITATELKKYTADALDKSLSEPVIVTRGARSRHVLCEERHYRMLWTAWMEKRGELIDMEEATLAKVRACLDEPAA